jgi:hypothetical protein
VTLIDIGQVVAERVKLGDVRMRFLGRRRFWDVREFWGEQRFRDVREMREQAEILRRTGILSGQRV